MKRTVLVFLKLPVPGRVKTRLARSIGAKAAAEAYKSLVSRVFQQIKGAPVDAIRVLFDPPEEGVAIRHWLDADLDPLLSRGIEITFHPQVEGDLGHRIEKGFAEAFAENSGKVAAIGTDCIDIAPRHFEETWNALDVGSASVFGPAEDGGYYLIALSSPHPELFRGIPWSAQETLERSIATAESLGLSVYRLETLTDIDDIESWTNSALS